MKVIKQVIMYMYKIIFKLASKIIKKDQKSFVFESFLGKQISDNPKALYNFMRENYPEYKLYWSIDRKYVERASQKNICTITRFSLKWLYIMNKSAVWISNSRMPAWIPKTKETLYIQTWHGTPLKKLALHMDDVLMPGTNIDSYKEGFKNETKKWDVLLSPNSYSTNIFRDAFDFDKTIIEEGYPRNDYLINENSLDNIKLLKEDLNLPLDKKIILYAPTWRDNIYYEKGKYKFENQLDLESLQKEFSDEYILILRLHYLIADNINMDKYKGFVFNMSGNIDINKLYLISDLLITDYSSTFFDYALLKRPMLFYMYDLDEYRDNIRGFYFDIEKEAPGPICLTTEELIKEIHQSKYFNSNENIKFYEKFSSLEDGNASEAVIKKILEIQSHNIRK